MRGSRAAVFVKGMSLVLVAAALRWGLAAVRYVRARRVRPPAASESNETRRSYVFGAISRQAFDRAMSMSIRATRRERRRKDAA